MDAIILDLGPDVHGESKLEGFKDKIEIMSYNHHINMLLSNDVSSTERSFSKVHLGEMSLSKFVDISTPILNSYCCMGQIIPEATLTLCRNANRDDGSMAPYLIYKMTSVIITNISIGGDLYKKPVENLQLNFTRIDWLLFPEDSTEVIKGSSSASWDLMVNKADPSRHH